MQSVGSSFNPDEIARLVAKGKDLINTKWGRQQKLFAAKTSRDITIENFLHELSNAQIHTIGPELIFGTLFDRIGFNAIPDELFRHITIARLAYPTSKLKTADYLYRYKGIIVPVQNIYRFLDTLKSTYQSAVEKISFDYTKGIFKGNISILFYDITTLYFETEDEDDLRKTGFSKDGKFHTPQIVLGLLVGKHGMPIGYNIFAGNTFEGKTLLPVLKTIQKKYVFQRKPIVIADAAMLSKKNMADLVAHRYQFILGGRIKNENDKTKERILNKAQKRADGEYFYLRKPDGTRLIVTFSHKRQEKDAHNRKRGIEKLRKKVRSGRLTKSHMNNRGYNKFLRISGDVGVTIDEGKIRQDKKWDGLKGYITNSKISSRAVVENYRHLWQIEKAFRISKTDLRIRPMYHYRKRRIEAHICIAFVAYTIYKELERLLYKHQVHMSAKRAAELTHTMYEVEYILPDSSVSEKIILKMNKEQQLLYDIICS